MIQIEGLSYRVGKTQILHDISLNLKPGRITALIGPNGAGKSSLLHCISGLHDPAAGHIRIDGLDPLRAPDRDRARVVALLQQSPGVVSRLRVRELVGFGRWPHHQGRPTAQDTAMVDAALESFALTDLADRTLESLSGGQRQRAFIAMTYAQDTPWLLLDEPLNALDPRHARDLMARLRGLVQGTGRSIVIVLHDINAAAGWADRIVAMKDGRVIGHRDTSDLLTPDMLETVFNMRFDVLSHQGRPVVIPR